MWGRQVRRWKQEMWSSKPRRCRCFRWRLVSFWSTFGSPRSCRCPLLLFQWCWQVWTDNQQPWHLPRWLSWRWKLNPALGIIWLPASFSWPSRCEAKSVDRNKRCYVKVRCSNKRNGAQLRYTPVLFDLLGQRIRKMMHEEEIYHILELSALICINISTYQRLWLWLHQVKMLLPKKTTNKIWSHIQYAKKITWAEWQTVTQPTKYKTKITTWWVWHQHKPSNSCRFKMTT